MTKQMSAMDIHFLCKELDELIDAKLDKVFNPARKILLLRLHITSKGRKLLKVSAPDYVCLSQTKEETEKHTHFCSVLRKYLNNSRLRGIKQLGFERVLELKFESKQGVHFLIIELFSKGNLILCNNEHKIISLAETQNWKDRTLRGGIKYELPPSKHDLFDIKKKEFVDTIKEDEKSVVRILAKVFGLGGKYSEEILAIADIDKDKTGLSDKEAEKLFETIKAFMKKKASPLTIKENNEIADFIPFKFKTYESRDTEPVESFNQAIETYFSQSVETKKDKALKKYESKLETLEKRFDEQEERVSSLKKDIKENKNKGEALYEQYSFAKDILDELNKARKKYSWKEIEEKIKGHKSVKQILKKEGKVMIKL